MHPARFSLEGRNQWCKGGWGPQLLPQPLPGAPGPVARSSWQSALVPVCTELEKQLNCLQLHHQRECRNSVNVSRSSIASGVQGKVGQHVGCSPHCLWASWAERRGREPSLHGGPPSPGSGPNAPPPGFFNPTLMLSFCLLC